MSATRWGRAVPESVKPVVLEGSRMFGRLSAGRRMDPDFLIVGGQRCGTTSMYRTLSQHPAVLKPVLHKGVHYFDVHYDKSDAWYRSHFPLRSTATRQARRVGSRVQTFESSPYYMFHPLAPQRIAQTLPDARVLVLIRDPVERAFSAHAHETARGFEDLPFDQALAEEDQRLEGEVERMRAEPSYESHAHRHQAYRTRGQYVDGLRALEAALGRERILVVDSHQFFTEPEPAYDGVLEFLNLPRGDYPNFERHNARPRPPMTESLRHRLTEYYVPFDEDLAQWLGWTPSWRR